MSFAAWVLALMTHLQPPSALIPWADTYDETAEAIATAATEDPLPLGEDAATRTASVMVVMAFRESNFQPDVIGDKGASIGLWQINRDTLGRPVPRDALGQARAHLELMHTSWRVCARHPLAERIGWYAAGGNGCSRRLELSRARMGFAKRLLDAHPYLTGSETALSADQP